MNEQMLTAYLSKVGFGGAVTPDLKTLYVLHQRQHQTIPFENLDVIHGKEIQLDEEALFSKLLLSDRGGYCYELNGLLHLVLQAVGYDVEQKLARVHLSGKPSGRGHLVNTVTIDGQIWLVDAGFGANTPRSPLPLTYDTELTTDTQTFRFVKDSNFGAMLQSKEEGIWSDLYSLDLGYVCKGDIDYGNHFASTGESSLFTANIVAVSRTEYGPNVLFNNRLKIAQKNGHVETILECEESYNHALKTHFNIVNEVPFSTLEGYFQPA